MHSIRHSLGRINEDCIMLEEVMRNLQDSVVEDALPTDRMPKTRAGACRLCTPHHPSHSVLGLATT